MDNTIQATPRVAHGKGSARKTRAAGHLPAVVYGPKTTPQSISVDPDLLVGIFKHTRDRNTVVEVKIGDGAAVPCLVREVQRHPLSREILHVDFYAVDPNGEVEVMVPLTTVGRAKGALLGGRIRLIRRSIKAMCRYDRIPSNFVIDVTELDIGDMVKASEVPLPEGVSLVYDHDYNIVTLYGKRRGGDKKKQD